MVANIPGFREACPEYVEGLHPGYKISGTADNPKITTLPQSFVGH
jgi:hypothetical protein